MAAWKLIAAAARRQLDSGCLRAAAQLGSALAVLGADLSDLLACEPLDRPPPLLPVSVPYGGALVFHDISAKCETKCAPDLACTNNHGWRFI